MRTLNFGWVFLTAAILILIFAYSVPWWAAILVSILATVEFKIQWS